MRRTRWMLYLWPGLPQLWRGGSWLAFAVAVVATALLNLALLAALVWSELISQGLRSGMWMMLGLFWVAAAVTAVGGGRRQDARQVPHGTDNRFELALDHYLKGNWFQTERVLGELLRQNVHDADARLMLATLLRRTGRHEEALGQLDLLGQLGGAGKWELEIVRERQLLAEAAAAPAEEQEEQADQGNDEMPHAWMQAA